MEAWGILTSASVAVDGLRFETVEYTPGHWAKRHAHGIAYMDLLLHGAQEARWDGTEARRIPGTLALMPVGQAHATDSIVPTRTFQVAIDPAWAGASTDGSLFTGRCADVEVGPITWGMTRMWAEFRRPDDLTPAVLQGRLHEFLDALTGTPSGPSERNPSWLRQAQEFVRAHARPGFAIADLAAAVGVDPAHLMRTYARHFGTTIGDDARNLRVAHACRLLAIPESTIGEIALNAGFADQSHLNRIFKDRTGLTPREYRATCLGT